MIANDIDEVIDHLDTIVAEAKAAGDVLGYFAAMYRGVTRRIKEGIDAGDFEDGPRMNRLDTAFANFYLRALATHKGGGAPSRPWRLAFDYATTCRSSAFQHLLVGMNAHINFDLAQAVVEDPALAADLPAVRADYDHINDILVRQLDPIQNALLPHYRSGPLVDRALGRLDENIVGWQIAKARAHAWHHAEQLAVATTAGRDRIVDHMDRFTSDLARRRIIGRYRLAGAVWWLVKKLERTDVVAIITSIESVG